MKQFLFLLLLVTLSVTAKAQVLDNQSGCDLEFRQVCFDVSMAPTCTVGSLGATWTSAPYPGSVALPANTCTPPQERGWQIRYAASTGCTGNTVIKSAPTFCTAYPSSNRLPQCACNLNPNQGPTADTDGNIIRVLP